ncbi:hypothetical protein OPV22_023147 [Ensete ventricosum]|uniref:F-box associated beta-propeller type 3 domain-containing protein n=1 Tax=Ensete ventricosum TaxID=4639 RepID=A0AAV8PCI3_ENSVE|nr:hypothetical protein OPV22_023147 [Ensete ventricosum]
MVYESSEDKMQAKMATFPMTSFSASSPEFGYLHSKKSAGDLTLLILSHRLLKENIISINPISLRGHHLHISDTSISNLVGSCSLNLVGAFNGFLCFSSFDHECVLVCNPITIELVILPKPGTTLPPEPLRMVYGFGFDSTSETYKVVRVSYSEGSLHNDANLKVSAEFSGADRIISFDIGKEESVMTPHPNFGLRFSISELGGCLSVVDLRKHTLIEVWGLKDQFNSYWQLEYILRVGVPYGLDMGLPRLISISEKNGVLLIWLQDAIFSNEQRTLNRKKLLISGLPSWLDWEIYCESGSSEGFINAGCFSKVLDIMLLSILFWKEQEIMLGDDMNDYIHDVWGQMACDGKVECIAEFNKQLLPRICATANAC